MPDGPLDNSVHVGFDRFDFKARVIGRVASRTLLASTRAGGQVLAVFDSSFYIQIGADLVCIGGAGLAAGPLNVITTAPSGTNWRASGVRVKDRISMVNGSLIVGRRFRFSFAGSTEWAPAPWPVLWTARDLEAGLNAFREACLAYPPAEGLGEFIRRDTGFGNGGSIYARARGPIRSLDQWLVDAFRQSENAMETEPDGVARLLGLGPGLTPSGDDFLGGMMIAAHSLGAQTLCLRLWRMIGPVAFITGNPIAFAHLSAASEGLGNIGIHRAIAMIIAGEGGATGPVLEGIDTIGRTSGWDAMAGVTRLFEAWLLARRGRC